MSIYHENPEYFEAAKDRPAALLSRETFRIDREQWVINEIWDLDHPRCPGHLSGMMLNPHYPRQRYPIQRVVTDEELRAMGQMTMNFTRAAQG